MLCIIVFIRRFRERQAYVEVFPFSFERFNGFFGADFCYDSFYLRVISPFLPRFFVSFLDYGQRFFSGNNLDPPYCLSKVI